MRIEHRPSKPRVAGSNPAGRAIWFSPAENNRFMVSVAQLVEPRIVIPVVVGSSPIVHPNFFNLSWHCGPLAQLVEQLTLNQ